MKAWILIALLFTFSFPARAWGPAGHKIVGKIAERYLTPCTKENITKLLHGKSLHSCTTWMDEMRRNPHFSYMADWHWVTIETGKTYEQSPKNPHGDIIATLEKLLSELKNSQSSDQARALRLIAHLIGDLHTPLHIGCCNDKGGNKIKVSWHGHPANLHHVWDEDLLEESKLSFQQLAESLFPLADKLNKKRDPIDIRRWAQESIAFRKQVYAIGDGELGEEYYSKNRSLLQNRLALAGLRLARVLNACFENI